MCIRDSAYREEDRLGGYDVYSMSKGSAELLIDSWRRSFFDPSAWRSHGISLLSARAGNVIGGGDWAPDRIVVDSARALAAGEKIGVRNPRSIRPWQHVLEPLSGYLQLGAECAMAGAQSPPPMTLPARTLNREIPCDRQAEGSKNERRQESISSSALPLLML